MLLRQQPRDVSKQVVRSSCKRMDKEFSQLLVDWGQYIDHDISFTPQASAAAASNHSACDNVDSCFPIQVSQVRSRKRRVRTAAGRPCDVEYWKGRDVPDVPRECPPLTDVVSG